MAANILIAFYSIIIKPLKKNRFLYLIILNYRALGFGNQI
jgi:hypothetical protein